jgi:hypothetical protein
VSTEILDDDRAASKPPKPISLTGAQCGDHVYFQGEHIGFMHRWAAGGVSVTLGRADDAATRRLLLIDGTPFGFGGLYTDSFIATDEDFAVGRFTWKPNPKRVERDAKLVADAIAAREAGKAVVS